jgi:cyclohexa-1,5-dienecarbonyl-CoA hydratase
MINVEHHERVVHLVINAPPVNVLDAAILGGLIEHLGELAADDSVAAVVMSGEGRCFSAGASVEEHKEDRAEGMVTGLIDACLALPAFPAPVIAAVHGSCLGGAMELISFCDFVVADPEAVFGQPEIKLAFFPPVALHQLPRLTGYQNAAHAILSGENLPAERAQSMGLVQKILPKDEWGQVDDLFNGLSAPVLRITKQALAKSLAEGCAERLDHFKALFMSELYRLEDVAEGITSFEERRRPEWKHS